MDAADLAFAGIARQAELIAAGEVSPRELVQTYLDRIERIDPQLNTFRVVLAERALAEADQAEARRASGDSRPLLGVPLAIKDDLDVAGELTAWGTAARDDGPAARDAEVVARLRAAGAIVLGKTNVPELMIFPFTESITWGVTRNPWNPDFTPGGSSGGSAAAVAAGLAGAALGSDGAGSIRIPSAWCGCFGLKPQRGRVPLAPRAEAWFGLSVTGPIARSVRDAALILDAVSGPSAVDRDSLPAPAVPFTEAATAEPGRLRVAVSAKVPPGVIAPVDPEWRAALDATAQLLRSLGHEVVERDPDYGFGVSSQLLSRYFRGIHDDGGSLAHPERLERRTRGMMRIGGLVSPRLVDRARDREGAYRERLGALFADCDVLMTPATATFPSRAGRYEGRGALWTTYAVGRRVPFNGIWNATGQPAAAVPAGFGANGLPLAVQLVGRSADEATLISLAAQIESARGWGDRRPPLAG